MASFFPDMDCKLTTDLSVYYKLDEASGTRADSIGSNDLTDNNTVGQATGKVSNAADFVAANSEYLSLSSVSAVELGDIDFTIACWVYFDDISAQRTILSKTDPLNGKIDYILRLDIPPDASNLITFQPGEGTGGTVGTFRASSFGSVSINTWYFVAVWHDASANQVSIQINNGAIDTGNTSGGSPGVSDAPFEIGAERPTAVNFMDGRIDEVGIWKNKVLGADERTDLYNLGNGNTYDPSGTCTPRWKKHFAPMFD